MNDVDVVNMNTALCQPHLKHGHTGLQNIFQIYRSGWSDNSQRCVTNNLSHDEHIDSMWHKSRAILNVTSFLRHDVAADMTVPRLTHDN